MTTRGAFAGTVAPTRRSAAPPSPSDYVTHVESFWEPGDILLPETQVPLDHLTGEKDATGTSDCIIIKPKDRSHCTFYLFTCHLHRFCS